MRTDFDTLESGAGDDEGASGGFLGMALLALALGAGGALLFAPAEGAETRKLVRGRLHDMRGGAEAAITRLQRELGRRDARRRRERRTAALIGLAVGAGAAALLLPASGQDTRRRIARTIGRGKDQLEEVTERTAREPEPEAQSAPSM
ncbi:MAG TPA: YtxH domain-containing protein [Gemmatimonadales bacterium]|jgi:gas vesicle protein|nr:YtxH domain-containing protein [Gemmatimonadales bacterium]